MNRIVVIGILFLFVCGSVVPISGFNLEPSSGNIITVDNEGDGDYTSIKQALNNANPWDTIEVYSGTYYERGIDVNKEGITLQGVPHELGSGNDTGKPFINGEGKNRIFLFDAKNISLDGFHIENGGGIAAYTIISVSDKAEGCTISNNFLAHSISAILWFESSNNKIINNNISNSIMRNDIGFYKTSSNNFVSCNNISNTEVGILLWNSEYNTIINNRISNCTRFGIDVTGSNQRIENNSLENNNVGIHLLGEQNIQIRNNNFINNQGHISYIFGIPLFICIITNKLCGNYWDDWRGFGPKIIWGLYLFLPCFDIDWHPAQEPYDI